MLGVLFLMVLAESIGLPVPAALGLLVAGGASARGDVSAVQALLIAYSAMLLGDNILFMLGRRTGWWLLSVLCRISFNPEACILRSADTFYRRGRIVLVFAKFMPGINTMAPPLAGSMNMPFAQFFPLDFAGTSLYILTYFWVGYLSSGVLNAFSSFQNYIEWIVGGLVLLWIAKRLYFWLKVRKGAPVPSITPLEVSSRDNVAIFDVRSHGYYTPGTQRIRGSKRIEPNALASYIELLPKDKEIVLYCTCIREATAVRVARMLAERGIPSAVLEGGLTAWKSASLPLEEVPSDEMVLLPKFA